MNDVQCLSHTKWDCKFHVVWIPKCRRKMLYGQLRKNLGEVFHDLARQKESRIVSYSRFTLTPSKYAVHINAFRKLLNRPRWAILDNLFILHQYFFGRSDDFS